MVTTFSSVPVAPAVLDPLLDRLAAAHAEQPLLPCDPRSVATRVEPALRAVGLSAVRIRGTVSWRGVEVDHVWLAVEGEPAWVVDAAFPLHVPAFAEALAGYVAGTLTGADLAAIALGARIQDRVVGTVPDPAVYRGRPYWGSRSN